MLAYKAQIRKLFHAHIKVKIPAFSDERLFDEFYGVLEQIDKHYNSYSEGSFFDKINRHSGEFVNVDDETLHILEQVLFFSELFDGEYDITIMPLIRLWGFYKDDQRCIPDSGEIAQAKQLIDYKRIEIKDHQVKVGQEQEIVTGSFMKSYAVDKLAKAIRRERITDAIINAGGSTILAINNKVHPEWTVDVKNAQSDGYLFKLKLSNACYSTSAQNKIFVEIDGQKYGHILSPVTGYPSANKQIGIISETCMIGDIISTGLFNQSSEGFIKKMKILSEQFPVSGFLVDKNNNITFTEGFEKNIIA